MSHTYRRTVDGFETTVDNGIGRTITVTRNSNDSETYLSVHAVDADKKIAARIDDDDADALANALAGHIPAGSEPTFLIGDIVRVFSGAVGERDEIVVDIDSVRSPPYRCRPLAAPLGGGVDCWHREDELELIHRPSA